MRVASCAGSRGIRASTPAARAAAEIFEAKIRSRTRGQHNGFGNVRFAAHRSIVVQAKGVRRGIRSRAAAVSTSTSSRP